MTCSGPDLLTVTLTDDSGYARRTTGCCTGPYPDNRAL